MDAKYKERIGQLDDYHKYLMDNEFIVHGYRLHFNSVKKILKSLFLFHNETINIWTHLIGALIFLILSFYVLFSGEFSTSALHYETYLTQLRDEFIQTKETIFTSLESLSIELQNSEQFQSALEASQAQIKKLLLIHEDSYEFPLQDLAKWPLLIFIMSALICLTCSFTFHLFSAHSHKMKICMNSLDYAGIDILILGSFYPPIYYLFYCEPIWIYIYLGAISVLGLFVLMITFSSNFQEPHFRWFRGVVFLLLGLCGVFPMAHIAFFVPDASFFVKALIYYVMMGVFYVGGVLIYIFRFPERYFHGKFDYIGNSHNIWHCMIIVAAAFHYFAAVESYVIRRSLKCSI